MIAVHRGFKLLGGAATLVAAVSACGDGGGGGKSFDEIRASLESPSGTVDATTTPKVAEAYEQALVGESLKQLKQNTTHDCAAGGSMSISASGDENNTRTTFRLNDCCQTPDCCQSGSGDVFYTSDSSNLSFCANYDLTLDCEEASGDVQYEYCFSDAGFEYVVRVEGMTFAVTGSYSNGNGSLEIRGENGSFSCTFTDGSGSCTGDGEFEF